MKWRIHFYELNAWDMSTELHARKYVKFYHGTDSIKCTKESWLTTSSCSFLLKFGIYVFRAKITSFIVSVTSLMFHFQMCTMSVRKINSSSIALLDSLGSNDVRNWTILTKKPCSTAGPFRNGRTLSHMLRILMRNGNNVPDQRHLYMKSFQRIFYRTIIFWYWWVPSVIIISIVMMIVEQ